MVFEYDMSTCLHVHCSRNKCSDVVWLPAMEGMEGHQGENCKHGAKVPGAEHPRKGGSC